MKWITRERPNIDRIDVDGIPYELPEAGYTHHGNFTDYRKMTSMAIKIYDARYRWTLFVRDEKHAWSVK